MEVILTSAGCTLVDIVDLTDFTIQTSFTLFALAGDEIIANRTKCTGFKSYNSITCDIWLALLIL